ncbi:hypothetical protein NKH18_39150 [Streptomyces sp. M10(2022)]
MNLRTPSLTSLWRCTAPISRPIRTATTGRCAPRGPRPGPDRPGIDAFLVTDYQAAVDLLRDTDTFTKDPVSGRKGARGLTGAARARLPAHRAVQRRRRPRPLPRRHQRHPRPDRAASAEGRGRPVARQLIGEFSATGSGDLIAQYARLLPLHVFTASFGVAPEDSERLVRGIVGMMDSAEGAAAAYADLVAVITGLVADRRARPGRDLTTYLLGHPAGLDDEETVRQITLIMSSGHDPTTNLIGNATLRMLSDTRYGAPCTVER